MAYKRRRSRSGVGRRGRRLMNNGQIVVRRAAGSALGAAMARYGPGAMRAAYRVARKQFKYKSGATQSRFQRKMGPTSMDVQTTGRMGMMSRRGTAAYSSKAKYGRKNKITYDRLVRMIVPRRVLRFSGVKRAEDGGGLGAAGACPGFYPCNSTIGDAVATTADLPLYVVQLNGTIINSSSATVLRRATLDATGRVQWTAQNGVGIESFNPTVNTTQWGVEYGQAGTEAATRPEYISNDWVEIRLNMYGAKENVTRYYIDLIQVHDDWAAIEDEAELAALTGTHASRYQDAVYGYWQNLIRPCVSNKISGGIMANKHRYSPYKVLRSWQYSVKPEQTTEENSTANFASAKLFIRDGRIINYAWRKPGAVYDATRTGGAVGVDDIMAAPNYVFTDYLSTYNPLDNPHPRARRYLVIRCDAPVSQSSGATGDNFTPSFDLIVRKKERVSPANRP